MKKKSIALIVSLMLIFQYFNFTEAVNLAHAAAGTISDNILTGMKLTTQKTPDTVIASVIEAVSYSNPDVRIDFGDTSTLLLNYEWKIAEGHNYKSGDTFVFKLPDELVLYNNIKPTPLAGEPSVGTLEADMNSRQVKLTFNENINDGAAAAGTMQFWTFLTEASVKNQSEVLVYFGIGEALKIKLKPRVTTPMTKVGKLDKATNPTKMIWTIDVNKDLKRIKNTTFADFIPAGSAYIDKSLTVNKLNIGLNGSTVVGDPVDLAGLDVQMPNSPDHILSVKFGEIDAAYRISLETSITNFDIKSFTNKATLTGDNSISDSATSTVTQNRGKSLEGKSVAGYNALDSHKIDWLIKYNYGEQPVAGKVITDLFDGRLELVKNSIKVLPVNDVNNDRNTGTALVEGIDYTINEDVSGVKDVGTKKGFILTFVKNTSSAFKISYQTKAKADFYVIDSTTVTNTVSTEDTKISTSQNIQQQFYHKNRSEPNYATKTIDWTIHIQNGNKYHLNNLVLNDTFNSNVLKLVPGTLVVKRDGVTLPNNLYTLTYKGGATDTTEGLTIKFNEDGAYSYKITYTTKFDYNDNSYSPHFNFGNKAVLDWEIGGVSDSKTKTATVDPNNQTKNNGFKGGTYDATSKQLTWNIGINYNSKKITNAVVTDKLTSAQKLISGSIVVKEMTVAANGSTTLGKVLTEGTDYTIIAPTTGNDNTLSVSFVSIDRPYHISFKTNLEGELINDTTITNKAILKGDGFTDKSLVATVNVPSAGEYVHKTGIQNTNDAYLVDWTVSVNRGQSTVNNAKIIDVPSTKQFLGKESFKLYETTVAGNGTVIKGNVINADAGVYKLDFLSVHAPDFDVQLTALFGATEAATILATIKADSKAGEEIFVLSFLNQINKPYILEYQTILDAAHNDTIDNTVSFIGTGVTLKKNQNNSSVKVRLSGGQGSGGTYRGSLTVTKSEEALPAVTLPGAVFQLTHNTNTNFKALLGTTDSKGILQFDNLPYGTYTLKEVTPPTGYSIIGNGETIVKVNSTVAKAIAIENKKVPTGSLIVTKSEETLPAVKLPGAVFKLTHNTDANFKALQATTDSNGVIEFNNLPYGTYTLKEITPPTGYSIIGNGETIVTINSTVANVVSIENKKVIVHTGSLIVVKSEEALPAVKLPGAVFKLTHNTDTNFKALQETTDANGVIQFNNLPYGTYTLKEITPPTGYSIIGNGESTVTINSTVASSVSIENKKVVVPTPSPVVPTPSPVVPTPSPVVPTPSPVVPTPSPVVPTPSPVVPTPSPVVPTPSPVVPTPSPVVPTPSPVVPTPSPVVPTPSPVDPTPSPIVPTPSPVDPTPSPVVPTPSPVDPTPSPVVPTPSPVDPTPSPVVPTPSPVDPTPSPVDPTPSPVVPTPSPVVPTPSPVDPTPSPVVPTPSPVVPTPSPVVPTPSPSPEIVKEVTEEETVVEGEIDVPKGGTTDIGTPPNNGGITVTPHGKWIYKPDPGFIGKDKFSIVVTDKDGTEEEVWFEIDVEEVPKGNIDITPDVDKLPKTGESSYLLMYLIGTAFIAGGITLIGANSVMKARRKRKLT